MVGTLGTPVSPTTECNPARLSAVRGHCGRPNNTVSYSYGPISGATLEEFNGAWDAAGYKRWIANFDGVGGGVCHWYAPALEGEDFIIDNVVQDALVVMPNPQNGTEPWDTNCPSEKVPVIKAKLDDVYSTECWHQLFYECGVDNTFTNFRDTGATITAIFDDGCPDATFDIPDGTGGWTAQINAISAGIASILPDSLQNSSYCTEPNTDPPVGCVGLPTPVIFLPDMKWRYAGFRICPGDKAPVKFIYNSDQRGPIELDYNIKASKIRYFDRCINTRTKAVEWIDCATGEPYEGELVDGKPPCAIPCTKEFPDPPVLAVCPGGVEPGCFFDAEGNQTLAGVTMLYKFCDNTGIPEIQYLTNYGQDAQEEVSPPEGGYFGDCASGQPFVPDVPVPECSDFELKDFYRCSVTTGTLRNREWDLGPRPAALLNTAAGQAIRLQGIPVATPTVDGDWSTLDANDTNNAADIQDLQLIEGFLKVTEPGYLRYATASAGYIAVFIGQCCGTPELVIEGSRGDGTFNPTNSTFLPAGIHSIQIWNIDDWSNTSPAAQWSTDGVTFVATNVPAGVELSRTKPTEKPICVKVCKDTGALIDLCTGELVPKADVTLEPLACEPKAVDDTECPSVAMSDITLTDDGSVVNYPLTATNGFLDHTFAVTLDDPTGCLAANPGALISLEYLVDHEAGNYPSHRAYILIASAGTFTAQSASNTAGAVGASNITIGYAGGDPQANQRNDRWVKITATAAEWLTGISFSTGFFGGVGGAYETINSLELTICEGVAEICDGC